MAYDRVLIRDLGSRNGVRVNGREVDESRLYQGDELAIGPILYRIEALDENPEILGAPVPQRAPSPQPTSKPNTVASAGSPTAARPQSARPDSDIDLIPLDDD